jgi:tetratricopeptide (TPR) repeat protein
VLCGAAAAFVLASLFSCLAPARAPDKPPLQSEPRLPYESIAASIAIGNPQAALEAYEAAVKSRPQARETRILHARLLVLAGKLTEAQEELELLLADHGRDARVLYNLAVVEGLKADRRKQKRLLEAAVEADGAYVDAVAALGDIALEEGQDEKAGEHFERVLRIDPENLVALLGKGAILARRREYASAIEPLSRAIGVQPDYPFSYIDRARARRSLGDLAGAIQDLSSAVRLDPSYPWTYIDRGKLYLSSGRSSEALEDFSMAIGLDDSQFEPFALRAELLYRAGRDDPALADYEKLVSLRPDYSFAYQPLGVLYMLKGDWLRAERAFREALRYQEDRKELALLAALAMRRGGRLHDAADFLMGVLPAMPRDAWEYDVARFLIDPAADFALTARIDRERNRAVRARMLFYVASVYLAMDKRRPAMSYLLEIENSGAPGAAETRLAAGELARLTQKE